MINGGRPMWYLTHIMNSSGLQLFPGFERSALKTLEDWERVRFDKMHMASESVRFGY